MKDAGLPLFPHGVRGGAEKGPVVHGVLGGVAQAALSTFALGSLVGHPGHEILYTGSHMGGRQVSLQHHTGTHLSLLVTPSPSEVHFFKTS